MRQGRFLLVLVLLLGSLTAITGSSAAQVQGSELVETVQAEAAGDEASIALESVEAFPSDGGQAVFEPGTENEEEFTYVTVDGETNRLVGLTRPTPLAHSAGAFVEAAAKTDADPAPSPSETPAGDTGTVEHDDGTSGSSPSGESADSSEGLPQVCEPVTEKSCEEVVDDTLGPIIGDPPTLDELCGGIQTCHMVEEVIDDLEMGDPCDPDNTGRTCDAWLTELADGAIAAICDPENTGQTCNQWLAALFNDPPCSGEACDVLGDPLGPWSVCDVNNTGEECPDADDVIDLIWSIDNPLSDLECTASVNGPSISNGGGMVTGRGTFSCPEEISWIEVTVCLHRASGGVWVKMGCRHAEPEGPLFVPSSISKRIAEPCAKQQFVDYRIRARGYAQDGADEDRDAAKATATLYCPGTSVDGAASDALEYAESWLPTND